MMLPHMLKEGGICIAISWISYTGPGDEGFYAVDTLSIGEDWGLVRLLSGSGAEGRADDFAPAWPTVLFADVRIAF